MCERLRLAKLTPRRTDRFEVNAILEKLEWLTKYGLIEIFFGIGVLSLIGKLIRKITPSNCSYLEVNPFAGPAVTIPGALQPIHVPHSLTMDLRNVGPANIYVARAYFRPKRRRWYWLWLRRSPTGLKVHPQAFRNKDTFALSFELPGQQAQQVQHMFTEYETLLRPVAGWTARTWLPLTEAVDQQQIEKRRCGVLYLEYASKDRQGLHVVRL